MTFINDFFIHAISKSKTERPNFNFYEFFCYKRLIHFKHRFKRSFHIEFDKNCLSCFLPINSRPKPKIALSCLDFNQFLWSKRLLHLKRHLEEYFYMGFENNRTFRDTYFRMLKLDYKIWISFKFSVLNE